MARVLCAAVAGHAACALQASHERGVALAPVLQATPRPDRPCTQGAAHGRRPRATCKRGSGQEKGRACRGSISRCGGAEEGGQEEEQRPGQVQEGGAGQCNGHGERAPQRCPGGTFTWCSGRCSGRCSERTCPQGEFQGRWGHGQVGGESRGGARSTGQDARRGPGQRGPGAGGSQLTDRGALRGQTLHRTRQPPEGQSGHEISLRSSTGSGRCRRICSFSGGPCGPARSGPEFGQAPGAPGSFCRKGLEEEGHGCAALAVADAGARRGSRGHRPCFGVEHEGREGDTGLRPRGAYSASVPGLTAVPLLGAERDDFTHGRCGAVPDRQVSREEGAQGEAWREGPGLDVTQSLQEPGGHRPAPWRSEPFTPRPKGASPQDQHGGLRQRGAVRRASNNGACPRQEGQPCTGGQTPGQASGASRRGAGPLERPDERPGSRVLDLGGPRSRQPEVGSWSPAAAGKPAPAVGCWRFRKGEQAVQRPSAPGLQQPPVGGAGAARDGLPEWRAHHEVRLDVPRGVGHAGLYEQQPRVLRDPDSAGAPVRREVAGGWPGPLLQRRLVLPHAALNPLQGVGVKRRPRGHGALCMTLVSAPA
mmetsp:Transcript_14670/g.41690  ORF Transcript_14670/g.41690 Transcript_14670/m.41690 type:complete len:592 (-) Transcript_14670:916-2691(-)